MDIYLDMDGVIVNWIGACGKLFNHKNLDENWPKNAENISEALNLPYSEIWKRIDAEGYDWWRNLPELSHYTQFMSMLPKYGNVTICTSPSLSPDSFKGKILWLQDRFGFNFRDYIFTSQKYHCAKEKSVLIDDTPSKIKDFTYHGGHGILFPQPWNGVFADDKVAYVEERLKLI